MDKQIIIFIVLLAIVFSIIRHILFVQRYPSASGSTLAKWSGLWYVYQVFRGDFERWNIKQHSLYGKIIRLAPNKYSIDDPYAFKQIYGANSPFLKTDWYSTWADPKIGANDNVFSIQDRSLHAAMRKQQSALYSMTAIKSYEPFVDECIVKFVEQLDKACDSGEPFDLHRWLQCYAFDTISQMTYGHRHGFVDAGCQDIDGILGWLWGAHSFSTILGLTFPWGLPFLILKYGVPLQGIEKFVGRLNTRAERSMTETKSQSIDESCISDDRPRTFFEKIQQHPRTHHDSFTEHAITVVNQQNLMAGSDTTGIALTSILYNCLKQPEVWQKLRTEFHRADQQNKIALPVKFEQTQSLPYLQHVIKEALRFHPSVGLPLWRLVPKGGMEVAGQFFPAGTWVGMNPWVAHHNTSVFGLDAHIFNPGRWDPAVVSREKLSRMEGYSMEFGAGARNCIGKHISMLEMCKLIPELVRRYDFELIAPDMPLETENKFFVQQKNVRVRVRHAVPSVDS